MLPEPNSITRWIATLLLAIATIHLSQFTAVHSEFDSANGLSLYFEIHDSQQPLVILREDVSAHSISSEIFTSPQVALLINTAFNETPTTGQ
jgi:hypothetical protein